MEKKVLTWTEVYQAIKSLPKGKFYGIPRGGAIVAGLTGNAVDDWKDADYILDDIIDSGRTAFLWNNTTCKPVIALFDKREYRKSHRPWLVFPWELNDTERDIKDTIVRQLEFIGEKPEREGLSDTPDRIIRSWKELYKGYTQNPKDILKANFSKESYDEMVVLKDIEFYSMCEHHMLPFFGKAKIAYIPKKKVVGISKLARLLEVFSRRLQIQERLTEQVAHSLYTHLKPLGVAVVLEAQHFCMVARGVQKQNSKMVTSCLLGEFKNNLNTREEFLKL